MKFVVDAHLSWRLVDWLISRGHEAVHVREIGLRHAEDNPIWLDALARNAIIVTKDADFAHWAATRRPAPQIVWLRTGNLKRSAQLEHLGLVWLDVLTRLSTGGVVIEIV